MFGSRDGTTPRRGSVRNRIQEQSQKPAVICRATGERCARGRRPDHTHHRVAVLPLLCGTTLGLAQLVTPDCGLLPLDPTAGLVVGFDHAGNRTHTPAQDRTGTAIVSLAT